MKRFVALGLLLALAGCGDAETAPPDAEALPIAIPTPAPPTAAEIPTLPDEQPQRRPLEAGQEMRIPAGVLVAGSRPGSDDRDPRREADLVPVPLPAFRIDRLPYPNDPNQPPLDGVSREEAAALCADAGKRLCNELEWERACKGDTDRRYGSGPEVDLAECAADPLSCASPFGVASMGLSGFEWTASDVTVGLGSERFSAVTRGAPADDPAPEHRCAARHALDPTEPEAGFRCCRGAELVAAYPSEGRRHPFRDRAVSEEELRAVLETIPELSRFAPRFSLFDAEAIDGALARGELTRDSVPFTIVDGVLSWSPEHGEEAWVFAGSDGESTVLAVIHPMPDGTFVHGSSFVIAGEEGPAIALGWDYGLRRQVLWAAAWGETGESGVVEHRDDHRIVIVQR